MALHGFFHWHLCTITWTVTTLGPPRVWGVVVRERPSLPVPPHISQCETDFPPCHVAVSASQAHLHSLIHQPPDCWQGWFCRGNNINDSYILNTLFCYYSSAGWHNICSSLRVINKSAGCWAASLKQRAESVYLDSSNHQSHMDLSIKKIIQMILVLMTFCYRGRKKITPILKCWALSLWESRVWLCDGGLTGSHDLSVHF